MEKKHKLEAAGLGKSPFRFTGMTRRVGPVIDEKTGIQSGAPGQPMGTCDYCGNGIAYCYGVESSDGKRSVLGSDCIRKVEDDRLIAVVKAEESNKRREANQRRKEAKWRRNAKLLEWFEEGHCTEILAAEPHPKILDKSAYQYVRYCANNPRYLGETTYRLIESALRQHPDWYEFERQLNEVTHG